MVSKIATFRLPENLIQEIRFRAEATGRDRTAIVVEALKQAFGLPLNDSRLATVEELQQQLNKLEENVTTLNEQLTELSQKPDVESRVSEISPVMEHSLLLSNSSMVGGTLSSEINGIQKGGRERIEQQQKK
jgi:predicted nuclease with TOPRIM domain